MYKLKFNLQNLVGSLMDGGDGSGAPVETPAAAPAVEAPKLNEGESVAPADMNADGTAPSVEEGAEAPVAEPLERPEWLQDRYMTEGKSMDEAIAEQAKGYNEIRGKLGAFEGAPETYGAFEFGEEVTAKLGDAGMELLGDDQPLMQGMKAIAKDLNMSQAGLNQLAEAYVVNQVEAEGERVTAELGKLGDNAHARIQEVAKWSAGLPQAQQDQLNAVTQTADGIQFAEWAMDLARGKPTPIVQGGLPTQNDHAAAVAKYHSDLSDPRMDNDPSFRNGVLARGEKLFPG